MTVVNVKKLNRQGKEIELIRFTMSETEFRELSDGYSGLCLYCGEVTDSGVEPDAELYECEGCGRDGVFGVEQCLIMGRIEFEGIN
jgi:hypothetical protein